MRWVEVVDGLECGRIVGVEQERLNSREGLELIPGEGHGANPDYVALGSGENIETVGYGFLHCF